MPRSPIELTQAEWTIIKAVWNREPCAAPDIQEALLKRTAWTYSTVRTLMDRMVAKGILTAEKVRNLTLYRSAVTRAQAQQSELRHALKLAFDGALTPMVQCLIESPGLTARDIDELEALLAARRKKLK